MIPDELIEKRQEAFRENQPVLREKSFEILLEKVKEKNPKKILEIGVNRGLSGIGMLLVSPSSHLTGIEIDEEAVKTAKENYRQFGVSDRVKIFFGDAKEIIPVMTGSYDFIFLDGPKGHYYEFLPHLLSVLEKNGILFADNVHFHGYVTGERETPHKHNTIKNSMLEYISAITKNDGLKTEILDVDDGISVTEKLY